MNILILLALVVMVAGLIGTLALSGEGEEDYSSSTKKNITRLTLIYVVLAVILVIGIVIYLAFIYLRTFH